MSEARDLTLTDCTTRSEVLVRNTPLIHDSGKVGKIFIHGGRYESGPYENAILSTADADLDELHILGATIVRKHYQGGIQPAIAVASAYTTTIIQNCRVIGTSLTAGPLVTIAATAPTHCSGNIVAPATKITSITGAIGLDNPIYSAGNNYDTDGVPLRWVAQAGKQTITLDASVTTFALTDNVAVVTGDAGANTIATITGPRLVGASIIYLLFADALVTITDDDSHADETIDLSAPFTSADDATLTLLFDGVSYYEVARSVPVKPSVLDSDGNSFSVI